MSTRAPGSYIDVNFPANIIPVADYAPTAQPGTESGYLMLSGTSASSPVVAGAAALMMGEDSDLTPDDVKVRLMGTADPVSGATEGQQGAGLMDVDQALTSTAKASGWALSPTVDGKKKVFSEGDYNKWEKRAWSKWGWTKYKWAKYKWAKFNAEKYKWADIVWTKYKWAKYKWAEFDWAKYKWATLIEGQ